MIVYVYIHILYSPCYWVGLGRVLRNAILVLFHATFPQAVALLVEAF